MQTYSANMKFIIFFLLVIISPIIIASEKNNQQISALQIPLLKNVSGAHLSGSVDEETDTLEQNVARPRKNCCTRITNYYQSWDAKKCKMCAVITSIIVVVGGTAAMAAAVRRTHTKN